MAAPAVNKCPRCSAPLAPGATTCPECGAAVGDSPAPDADAEIYPELAKANVARMRGDYKGAENQLLHILKLFPNNPTANEMLGDLAAERNDLDHAAQWYEMALEIVPNSVGITRKLEEARAKLEAKEAKDTTAQLGLPDPSSRAPIVVGILVVFFLACIIAAYYFGLKGGGVLRPLPTPINRISAIQPEGNRPPPPRTQPTSAPPAASEDSQLLEALKGNSADAASILSAELDPRSGDLVVTVQLSGKNDRDLAARVARDSLLLGSAYNMVTIRGISDGKVAYMADATRAKLVETQSADWKAQHGNSPDAWVDDLLQNEWPASSSPPSAVGSSQATGGSSSPPAEPATGTSGTTSGGE
ncbi:MAG TPA: tetratricopeptide repeat protein [Fimbriimonadaceae bacterium]|nr:tetratricopeptide repeat protein [Fimbriimonadaceae bacterium]